MSRVALDTSVLVAAIQSWHAEHPRAARAVAGHLERSRVVLATHVLLETYSVLTRMPKPHRMSPRSALTVLQRILPSCEVVGIGGDEVIAFLPTLPEQDIAGGAVYDAVITRTALQAGARMLVTLNSRHFARLAPQGLEIVEP